MSVVFTRRRVLTVLAAAAGVPLLMRAGSAQARLVKWEGTAMGAPASLSIYHTDEKHARAAIEAAVTELNRLEGIFSLYRADSAMSQLNRDGALAQAPIELVEAMGLALETAAITGGAFDPTVQPLWQAYFTHFTAGSADSAGPAAEDIAAARALVGWQSVAVENGTIRFERPGMGVTLNGIAQGIVTDRVAAVLRAHGLERMLVDMGEPKALSAKPDGSAWVIAIADPRDPSRTITSIDAVDKAVATSGGYGTTFDAAKRFTHLIDPASGTTAPADQSVTVIADSAAKADALSTALAVAPVERHRDIIASAGGVTALFVSKDGGILRLPA
ncbi:MAG TPA: FAD:protein FMN transferase [Candidatus Omnitrophota bacterium]|nr:FAD:protein FMN transferase [Candidatus Omnitrophota bacterium]